MVKGDRHEFRAVAQELNIDPDSYIEALHKVCISDEESVRAGADLLGIVVNNMVSNAYYQKNENARNARVSDGIDDVVSYINNINSYTKNLDKLEKNQKILAFNASIESARAGEAGRVRDRCQ